MNPRVLFVGRGRLSLPLAPWLLQKWDALSELLDLRVLNVEAGSGDARAFTRACGTYAQWHQSATDFACARRALVDSVIEAAR